MNINMQELGKIPKMPIQEGLMIPKARYMNIARMIYQNTDK